MSINKLPKTMKLQFSGNYDKYLMIYNSLRATAMALNRDQHSGTTSTADKGWLAGLDHFLEQLFKISHRLSNYCWNDLDSCS